MPTKLKMRIEFLPRKTHVPNSSRGQGWLSYIEVDLLYRRRVGARFRCYHNHDTARVGNAASFGFDYDYKMNAMGQ